MARGQEKAVSKPLQELDLLVAWRPLVWLQDEARLKRGSALRRAPRREKMGRHA